MCGIAGIIGNFGEKPFLYHEGDGYFAFASEYKALFRLQGVTPNIAHGRLLSFLHQPRHAVFAEAAR